MWDSLVSGHARSINKRVNEIERNLAEDPSWRYRLSAYERNEKKSLRKEMMEEKAAFIDKVRKREL